MTPEQIFAALQVIAMDGNRAMFINRAFLAAVCEAQERLAERGTDSRSDCQPNEDV